MVDDISEGVFVVMKFKMNGKKSLCVYILIAIMVLGIVPLDSIEAEAADNRPVLSILGDSLSAYCGYESSPYYGLTYEPKSVTYIMSEEDMWWSKYASRMGYRIGWPGAISASMVTFDETSLYSLNNSDRINRLEKNGTPDVIAVFGGVNDHVLNGAPPATFSDRYNTLLSRLHNKYPNAKIICMAPYHLQNGDFSMYDNTVIDAYAEIIKNLAKKYGDYYVDLRTINFNASDFDKDGSLHINESGHAKIADKLCEAVDYVAPSKPDLSHVDTGAWLMGHTYNNVSAGLVSFVNNVNDYDYQWLCYDCRNDEWITISDWKQGDPWVNWNPTRGGDLLLYGRIKPHKSDEIVGGSCFGINHEIVSATCQMPNPYWGGGWLIGISTYDNPNNSYRYELCVLDCNRYVNGDPNPWVYSTGKMNTGGGNTAWTIWQPLHGYYWTLFRIYDNSGKVIDQRCFGFVA